MICFNAVQNKIQLLLFALSLSRGMMCIHVHMHVGQYSTYIHVLRCLWFFPIVTNYLIRYGVEMISFGLA